MSDTPEATRIPKMSPDKAQEIARDVGRPIATHDEARALYQLG